MNVLFILQQFCGHSGATARRLRQSEVSESSEPLVRPHGDAHERHNAIHFATSEVCYFATHQYISYKYLRICFLGRRASFLYGQSSLSRGQDTREANLNALFRYRLDHIKPDVGNVLALISFQGKTNQVSENKNVVGCYLNEQAGL